MTVQSRLFLRDLHLRFGGRAAWIYDQREHSGLGQQLPQHLEALAHQLGGEKAHAGKHAGPVAQDWERGPGARGSPPVVKTIGMVEVAALAASPEGAPPVATITATRRCTRSAASSGRRSVMPFRPTKYDRHVLPFDIAGLGESLPKRRNKRGPLCGTMELPRNPITGSAGFCAAARAVLRQRTPRQCPRTSAGPSLDHLVRPRQHRLWNGEAESLGGLLVDH